MKQYLYKFFLVTILFFIASSYISANNKIEHKIAVLVNEEIITSYDIIQRLKLTAIIKNINPTAQSTNITINNIVDELIQEKLKLEKINEYNIKVTENEYLEFENSFFERNKVDKKQMILSLKDNGVSYQDLKDQILNEFLWSKLISRLYYRLTSVSEIEVNSIIKNNPLISLELAENLVIQRQLDLKSSKLLRDMMNEATIEYR
tara:strand:+ start:1205 stop:1819 length:615 start_codon:yes stop_codon:yes gene_type:complete